MAKKSRTRDALGIIHRRYYQHRAEQSAALEAMRADDQIGRRIAELREKAGLTPAALGRMVGLSASDVRKLEDADYDGSALGALLNIADALNTRVELRVVPRRRRPRAA